MCFSGRYIPRSDIVGFEHLRSHFCGLWAFCRANSWHYTPRDKPAPRLASSHSGVRGTGARSLEKRQYVLGGGRGMADKSLAGLEKMDIEFFLRTNTRIIFTVKLILSRYWLKQELNYLLNLTHQELQFPGRNLVTWSRLGPCHCYINS